MTDLNATLAERGARYGDFTDHAEIAQALVGKLTGLPNWTNLSAVQRQALTVIMDKVARILSGDPNYADNWHDIQGYAKLAEDRLALASDRDVAKLEVGSKVRQKGPCEIIGVGEVLWTTRTGRAYVLWEGMSEAMPHNLSELVRA